MNSHRHFLADKNCCNHRQRKPDCDGIELLAQQRHGKQHRQKWLHQLHLTDAHRTAQGQAAVPGKKAQLH